MSVVVPAEPTRQDVADTPSPIAPAGRAWLVSPWFDALFVANVCWPLLLLPGLLGGFHAHAGVQFWQIYFITTPHRWITLLLVFGDRERFVERRGIFLTIAAGVVLTTLLIRATAGTLLCLLTIDYIWNAWHFAAQHHGIFRIYGRLAGRSSGDAVRKILMRGFLCYVPMRVAGWSWAYPALDTVLQQLDWVAALAPLMLLGSAVSGFRWGDRGGLLYLASVSTLFLSLLFAVHFARPDLVLLLATASALFHAIEYLAVVSWSVTSPQRHAERRGALGWLTPRWWLALATFAVVLGLTDWMFKHQRMQFWIAINVVVAFL
ncbi:MAG TPA: hypothetical protein VHB77_03000, partial [Planctomycetaceae bacterium]|nr:hypothetical protein [Planctomycetaceae bacterium]